MALVNMRDMLHHAYHNGYAVGGFDLVSLEFLRYLGSDTEGSPQNYAQDCATTCCLMALIASIYSCFRNVAEDLRNT